MEIVSFDDIDDVYGLVIDEMTELEDPTEYVAVYGKVDLIKELFTTMISDGYEFGYADFDTLDEMHKDTVYMIFIRENGVISVEPAYGKDGVVMGHDAKVAIFYMDDCKQDVIDYCVNRDMEVVLFDFEDDECDECCNCCQCDSDVPIETDGNMHGFNVSNTDDDGYRAFSFYSTDLDLVKEMAKMFK